MRYTSQHCCDKTVDGKIALYRERCFLSELYKFIVKNVAFPIAPPSGSSPAVELSVFG